MVLGAGVCPHNFVVGHSDGTEDIEYQKSLADRGVFVGFDRFGLDIEVPDAVRIRNFKGLVDAGYRDSLLMSHDYVNCWMGGAPGIPAGVSTSEILPHWNMTHIFERIIPELKSMGMTDADFESILCDNTARFLTVD
jgi:phosphotriesterase-related protein